MPLIHTWENKNNEKGGIWQITESETFFRRETGLDAPFRSDRRRQEFLAGRFLLKILEPHFPIRKIIRDAQGKPQIPGNIWRFSLSHSFPFVAAVLSSENSCGIDIQTWRPGIQTLQNKFLSKSEQQYFQDDPKMLILAWTAKEAIYKWQGKRGIDFKKHLHIENMSQNTHDFSMLFCLNSSLVNQKPLKIAVPGSILPDFAYSYIYQKAPLFKDIKSKNI